MVGINKEKRPKMEKILLESPIGEPGFDKMSDPKGGTVGNPPDGKAPSGVQVNQDSPTSGQGNTNTSDVAQYAKKGGFAQGVISASLPMMLSYVQPINGPVGYAYALQQRKNTKVPHNAPGVPNQISTDPEDLMITRRFVETGIREVKIDMTNETAQDIVSLFGQNFIQNWNAYLANGGELYDGPNGPLASFFLDVAMQRMAGKINKDFTAWLKKVASDAGSATIADCQGMKDLECILGEMRGKLFSQSNKSTQYWILVTPTIAGYLATRYGARHNPGQRNRRIPNPYENGYVTNLGDIEVYQYDFKEPTEKIFMGQKGQAGTASIFYYPYKNYIIQGGEDYRTGQSDIFCRVRDAWELNPLDVDGNQLTPTTPPAKNNSNYVIQASITITKSALA